MIREMLRALVYAGVTLLGAFLLVGLLANVGAPMWLVGVLALAFTCAMFLLHARRGSSARRRAKDAFGGYYAGSSEGAGNGGDRGSGGDGGGWFGGGGWGDGGGDGGGS